MYVLKQIVTLHLIKNSICMWALLCVVFLNGTPALAHKVSIFAWVEGDTVHTQSKFMGGKRPERALVEVFDDSGNQLLKGETDSQGFFSFQTPGPADMQIVLTAGMGHRAVWSLSRADFEETAAPTHNNLQSNTVTQGVSHTTDSNTDPLHTHPENELSPNELTALVESTLDRKLKPIMDQIIALNEDRISISDILGGIGYILGLVGLAAFMKYHRKKDDIEK
jgi:nickel transport protein